MDEFILRLVRFYELRMEPVHSNDTTFNRFLEGMFSEVDLQVVPWLERETWKMK